MLTQYTNKAQQKKAPPQQQDQSHSYFSKSLCFVVGEICKKIVYCELIDLNKTNTDGTE